MAEVFDRKTASITNSEVTVYTVPASTQAILLGFSISNTTSSQIEVDISIAGIDYGKSIPIPVGSALNALNGKIVLNASDTVKITSSAASSGAAIISLLEIS